MNDHFDLRAVGDVSSASITVAALVGLIPTVSALLTIIWVAIRIWETRTVQGWVGGRARTDQEGE